MCGTDILLSEEAPESDYEYVNPVRVILINDDKDDDVALSSRSVPPPSPSMSTTDNSKTSPIPRSRQTNPPSRSPSAVSCLVKTKPISLPPMPNKKRLGPPAVPPRKQSTASDGSRDGLLDRDGYLRSVDDYDDSDHCMSEPLNVQVSRGGRGSRYRQPALNRRPRRANSVDSLLSWHQSAVTMSSSSDSESEMTPSPRTRNRLLMSTKFRGDLGLVPTNIASLGVEEVNVYDKSPKLVVLLDKFCCFEMEQDQTYYIRYCDIQGGPKKEATLLYSF